MGTKLGVVYFEIDLVQSRCVLKEYFITNCNNLPLRATQIDTNQQVQPPRHRGHSEGHTHTPAAFPSGLAFFEMAGKQGQGVGDQSGTTQSL